MHVEPGTFLIAGPGLLDANFRRSVVLICDHNDQGALGLVINRPLRSPLSQVFPELLGLDRGFIYNGGPVETQRMMALRRGPQGAHELDQRIFDDVHLVVAVDDLIPSVRAHEEAAATFRFFVGYAGWGPGQLEGELKEGAWIVAPARPELVFETAPGRVWVETLRGLGGSYAVLAEIPLDPSLN